jgi:peptide/nickel transport system permease protein
MVAYIVRRLLLIIPTFFLVTVLVFLSVRFIPGDVIDMMVSQMSSSGAATNLSRESLEKALGLDAPIYIQYLRWLGVAPQPNGEIRGLLEGDFGKSLWNSESVTQLVVERLPVSIELGLIAMITALLISIPIGVYSARSE